MSVPKNYDGTDVRKILTGMARDRAVCSRIVSQWTPGGLFAAPWANIVGGLIAGHFKKYGDPPNGQMPSLFGEWARTTNAPDETIESVEKFLHGISDEAHQDAPEYLLDLAGKHFNKVRIDAAIAEAKQLSDHWQVDEAKKVLEELHRVNLGVGAYLEPAKDIGPWLNAFDTQHKRPMVLYPGDLGTFFGDCFQRGRFFSFVAPDKTGKTHWLIDFAYRALRNRQYVAYFDTGDGDEEDFHRRLAIRVSEFPEYAKECQIPKTWEGELPIFEPEFRDGVDAVLAYRKFHRQMPGEGALRFISQPLGTLSVEDIEGMLDVWDRETEWRPDVCVASGSMVLTDRGLVPIEHVACSDRLWDGCNWVSHDGLIFKGVKNVISYAGLTATPEHELWTDQGWRTIESCRRLGLRVAQTGIGGERVRAGERYISDASSARKSFEKRETQLCQICACQMQAMRAREVDYFGQFEEGHCQRLQGLFAAEAISDLVLVASGSGTATMPKSQIECVERLWGSGNRISISDGVGRLFVDNCKFGIAGEVHGIGSNRERRALRTGEFEIVNAQAESIAYTKAWRYPENAQVSAVVSRCSVCGRNIEEVFQMGDGARGNYSSMECPQETMRAAVWDIRNAGPLHRFTVQGILAHNCVVDYADTMAAPTGIRDNLEQIDETWRALRRLSQKRHCLVITATQTSSLAYKDGGLLGRKHFSGRKTKNAHVSGMIGINVTDDERKRSMARINKFSWRHGKHSESECIRVAGCADIGNFVMLAKR